MVRQYHAAHLGLTHRDALFALGWVNRFSSYLVAMSLGPRDCAYLPVSLRLRGAMRLEPGTC